MSLALLGAFVGGMRTLRLRPGPTVVQEGEPVDRRALSALGGRLSLLFPWLWTFAAPDNRALARVFTQLRDAGVQFLSEGGHNGVPLKSSSNSARMVSSAARTGN